LEVSALAGFAPTKKSLNGAVAVGSRWIVAPLPSIVIELAIAGNADGPYHPARPLLGSV
jgi:hypothetical protein